MKKLFPSVIAAVIAGVFLANLTSITNLANPGNLTSRGLSAFALMADPTGVIPRETWGADESYRYMSDNSAEPILIELSEEFWEKYGHEISYTRIVEADENGNKYKWPLKYAENVSKIIIHHTATTKNLDNPAQAIRDIYRYHAVTEGWGDIGYNYIVDQQGNIYEGRYGGESVEGGHAGPGNHGSIGIAVLGNYENDPVPEEVIISLAEFIHKKAKIHNIDPEGFSEFRGEVRPNIFGHGDIMNTACPGNYLEEKLPVIRSLAAEKFEEKEKFVKDYDFQDQTELYYLELKPEETVDVELKFENIGNKSWNNETYIVVNKNYAFDDVISFPSKVEAVLAEMEEAEVKSGEIATFKFQVKAARKHETVFMDIAPVINGEKKLNEYTTIPVSVQQPIYKYEFVEADYPPEKMRVGEEYSGYVKIKNTGNMIWRNSGSEKIMLRGDSISAFTEPDSEILSTLEEDEILPGETGTFRLNLKAPEEIGNYIEKYKPYMQDIVFSPDELSSFDVVVYDKDYNSKLISKTPYKSWEKGKSYDAQIKLRNLGEKTWKEENFAVAFLKESDLKISNLSLSPQTIKTGEIATIDFRVKIDKDEELEDKNMFAYPKINDSPIYKKPLQFKYTVESSADADPASAQPPATSSSPPSSTSPPSSSPSSSSSSGTSAASPPSSSSSSSSGSTPSSGTNTASSDDQPQIRVKISFEGEPEISANGSFEVYSGEDHLITLSSGEIAKISKVGTKYKVDAEGNIFLKNEPIRFIPKNSAILRIDNFENHPAWNEDLNDNEYRGVLEVNDVDNDDNDDVGNLIVINELNLEDYMKGVAEVLNSDEPEKIKAVMVAARTYAAYYLDVEEKFPGKPYNLDDNPDVSQKYLGYGFEKRAQNVANEVEATEGKVVTYEGALVKTPYFNQSDGTVTKSAYEVWGWTHTPYLISVSDSFCAADEFRGHGVGLSGCGAMSMAQTGATYEEILKHYYTGVEIEDL